MKLRQFTGLEIKGVRLLRQNYLKQISDESVRIFLRDVCP